MSCSQLAMIRPILTGREMTVDAAMTHGQLSVVSVVVMGYRDLVRVLRTLTNLVLIALAISLALQFLEYLFLASWMKFPVVGTLLNLGLSALRSFLLTPFYIAVHRFVILDEITRKYSFAPHNRRFSLFFAWSFALTALVSVLELLLIPLLVLFIPWAEPKLLAMLIVIVGAAIVVLRLTIIFPAIAVDAPGADAPNALADTKGHASKMFAIFLVASLPFMIVDVLIAPSQPVDVPSLAGTLISAVVSALFIPLLLALASRLYQILADRLVAGTSTHTVAPT
jgi:hypothetical protein